jgi:hypothetical protein
MAAKKTSKAASPANNTRSRGRDQVPQEKSATLKEITPSTATPRNTRSRSKSGSGSTDKATAKQQPSSGEKTSSSVEKTPAPRSKKPTTNTAVILPRTFQMTGLVAHWGSIPLQSA